jgi:hypothetical protein
VTLSDAEIADRLDVLPGTCASGFLSFVAPLTIRRRGVETRIATGDLTPRPDPVLLRTLAQAHVWTERLKTGTPLATVAQEAGHSASYIRTRAPLAFLSPTIQQRILAGTQPPGLSLERLVRSGIPFD